MSDSEILVRTRPPVSVLDFTVEEIVERLRRALEGRGVREAYIFGSVAAGRPHAWSDVDLILVTPSQDPFIERPRRFWDLLDLGIPLDILVYTPEEFARLWNEKTGFWRTVRENHIRIL
ncbi:Nucleotidyltransferase domain-containing protein [Desulfacinum infernum DSM 9756]|uniref:Nucleotidyltransferase domain-containing protein n=1 Tax=Desulfacinum infernum DSM 9756 TaxID=1121391 RepID=A0A1M4YGZ4_9BACT|nr:nucleotidyltransferase domain-containing protein [Desulfacinum infernum]SHF04792.1 Nucleotidyltransferase domain-containing protein [Desulfacinum infernum DSM 9756]